MQMNNFTIKNLYSEKYAQLPSVNSLLKISLGLILFTMISAVFAYAETMSVNVDGTSFDMEYDATGMIVSGIDSDTDFISLILTVDVTESIGILDITLDRSFFDSSFEGLDDDFIILADGDEPNFSETATTIQSRTLSIELPAGTEEIEIIGSVFGDSTIMVPDTSEEDAKAADAKAADAKAADAKAADAKAADAKAADAKAADAKAADAKAADAKAADAKAADAKAADAKAADNTLPTQCGPGTILEDGACVLDLTSPQTSSSSKGMGKESLIGFVVAFLGAGIVAVVFGIIAKSQKNS